MKVKQILFAIVYIGRLSSLCAVPPENYVDKEEVVIVQDSFEYLGVAFSPFPLPLIVFNVGQRTQLDQNGFDLSVNFSVYTYITQVKISPMYLRYINPNVQSQFYVGGGLSVSGVFTDKKHPYALLSPELLFGKEYKTTDYKMFFQAQMSFPSYKMDHSICWVPALVFSYGVGF